MACVCGSPILAAGQEEAAQPLYAAEGIRPQAVRQGALGSCYFHSVVAALAATDPQRISKMIRENSDGTYTVQFADGQQEIAYPEDIQYSRQSGYDLSDGLWVAVLFRAYAQSVLRQGLIEAVGKGDLFPLVKHYAEDFIRSNDAVVLAYDRAIRSQVDQLGNIDRAKLEARVKQELQPIAVSDDIKDSLVKLIESGGFFDSIAAVIKDNGEIFGAYRAVGQGGVADRVMDALAGSAADEANGSAAEAAAALARGTSAHRPMVACTAGSQFYKQLAAHEPLPASARPWYVNAHCYTVLGYDAAAQTVTLRNPWGQPPPDGTFRIPVESFVPAFRGIVTTRP
jgi:Calpain family cysteine protease